MGPNIMSRSRFISSILLITSPSLVFACLWDYDTLKMERTRFPNSLELITGKFLRHSPEFYQWRIEDRLKRLKTDPKNVTLMDDLAVAYDKTKQHDKAIEIGLKTEEMQPGRYETAANLGTFYMHAGNFEEGLKWVDRALKINPDAHFGREKYQKILAEYLLSRRNGRTLSLPMAKVENLGIPSVHTIVEDTFAKFLAAKHPQYTDSDHAAALKGVQGMMRFANFESPILLEALASLLTEMTTTKAVNDSDAKLLAARALLKASYQMQDDRQKKAYRDMASRALYLQTPRTKSTQITLEEVEEPFKKELKEAQDWYAQLRAKEIAWIAEGKNPEAEFDKLYTTEPEMSGMDVDDPMSGDQRSVVAVIAGLVAIAVGSLLFVLIVQQSYRLWRRSRMKSLIEIPCGKFND